jgi:WhiB family redox-sensing transcriptional regulator
MTGEDEIEYWRDSAACRHADPELFFPDGVAGPALRAVDEVRLICRGCSVRARCLDWALQHGAAFGIWGGRTEDERRAARAMITRPRSPRD